MNWSFFKNGRDLVWLFISILIPTIIILSSSIIMSLFGKTYIFSEYSIGFISIIIFISFVGCIGEEIGWRGFMLPAFNIKYTLFTSSLFTGTLWGAWHIGKIVSFGMLGYLLFILLIIEFSVLMSWIFTRSKAKMINMIFFHLGVNVSSLILLTNREGIMFYAVACTVGALISMIIVLGDRKGLATN